MRKWSSQLRTAHVTQFRTTVTFVPTSIQLVDIAQPAAVLK